MRFNQKVTFWQARDAGYDPRTSQHRVTYQKEEKWANVTAVSAQNQMTILGRLADDTYTVRTTSPPSLSWNFLTIGNNNAHYILKSKLQTLKGCSWIVGVDNGNS